MVRNCEEGKRKKEELKSDFLDDPNVISSSSFFLFPFSFPAPVSLYFHIPFCTKKCAYCHFYVLPNKESFKQQLMQGLSKEWQKWAPLLKENKIQTIYFGGGTPSLFGPERIAEILSWMPTLSQNSEITLEVNPEDVSLNLIRDYANAGINRISMGLQSLDNALLEILTRTHSAEKAIEAVYQTAEAGIKNISVDLMYELPSQTIEHWQRTLERVVTLPITHLSLYNLTIEPHTVFFKNKDILSRSIPSQEISTNMYLMAIDYLEKAGLKQYEISAFAREGYQSQHNSGYWTGRPFIGLGPSAFSYWEGKRFRNIANLSRYCQALESGKSAIDFEEELSPKAKQCELLAIKLRLRSGCLLSDFSLDDDTLQSINKLIDDGFLEKEKECLRLTQKGILFYDTVASELVSDE